MLTELITRTRRGKKKKILKRRNIIVLLTCLSSLIIKAHVKTNQTRKLAKKGKQ